MLGARGALAPVDADAVPRQPPQIRSFDHVSIPGRRLEEMAAFYRALGMTVRERGAGYSIHFGDQKINLHAPSRWEEDGSFSLRAPAAVPPCGDFCWVFEGTRDELVAVLDRAGARIEAEGERDGGRDTGRRRGQSIYFNKIGAATGWTYGGIKATCAAVYNGTRSVVTCAYKINTKILGGDSGAPVFYWPNWTNWSDNEVSLAGMVFAKESNGNKGYFNPVGAIENDLGSLIVY